MKVYNLTNTVTPALRRGNMDNTPISVDGVVIPPGACREVKDTSANRKLIRQKYVVLGMLALDTPPEGYIEKKEEPKKAPPPKKEEKPPLVTQEITLNDAPPDTQPAPVVESEESQEEWKEKKKRRSRRGV